MSSNDDNVIIRKPYEEGYDFYIKDKWGGQHHFRICTFEALSGLVSKAIEVTENHPEREARMFEILSDFEADIEEVELNLKARIKRSINRRHLQYAHGKLSIAEDTLRGRFEESIDYSDNHVTYYFVIDGKRISIEQFVEMLKPFSGFDFKFQIYDPSDEIA